MEKEGDTGGGGPAVMGGKRSVNNGPRTEEENKQEELLHILNSVPGCAIVYTRNRKRTREIAELLVNNGITATFYHAGLNNDVKDQRQKSWLTGESRTMVATNAFGMGIDKPDVRIVIHID